MSKKIFKLKEADDVLKIKYNPFDDDVLKIKYNPFDDDVYDFMTADKKAVGLKKYIELREKAVIYLNKLDFTVAQIAKELDISTGSVTNTRLKYNLTLSHAQVIAIKRSQRTNPKEYVEKSVSTQFTLAESEEIKQLIAKGNHTYDEIAKLFGTVKSQICFVKQNKFIYTS